MNSIHHF